MRYTVPDELTAIILVTSWVNHCPSPLNNILKVGEGVSKSVSTVVLIFLAGVSGFPSEPIRKLQTSFEKKTKKKQIKNA
jgi:hypothetical protein